MNERAPLWGQLLALVRGEVSADTLEAYRHTGAAVYEALRRVEDRRLANKIEGVTPWAMPEAEQVEALCAWNAFALQTLGDQFVAGDYVASPLTVGYVPPVTAEQVMACYSQVEGWVARARQARTDPAYRLDVPVPADLPPWAEVEPCPRPHLEAMLAAAEMLRAHAEATLAIFEETGTSAEHQAEVRRLQALLAEANAKVDYGQALRRGAVPPDLHEQIERRLTFALERYYHLGQILAMPRLLARYPSPPRVAAVRPAALPPPGRAGFDPWCLTDPASRARWQQDPAAREAVKLLWEHDPEPERTLAIQAEIDAALARGDIADATGRDGARIGQYYCCPWAPVRVVKRPVTLGGRSLQPLQQFTFDVSAEEMAEGGPFKREILVGQFEPTSRIDYCNPRAGGHDDEG